jgi:mannosyltransferase OCH1-like enzyme
MIPRIIHQIWVGNNPLPEEFKKFSDMWKSMYPDFEYVLWNDLKVHDEEIISFDKKQYYFDSSFPFAFKADILRYEIIRKYGGVYIDIDTEPLKRMDDEISTLSFFSGIQNNGEVAIGIFGAEKNNELMNKVCDNWMSRVDYLINHNGMTKKEVHFLTGPVYFTYWCKSYFGKPGYKFFDPKYFYPYWFLEKHRRNESFKDTSPEAYSVHHWYHSWK